METSQAGIPEGRQIIGRYAGVETVRYRPTEEQEKEGKQGTPVKGMYEVKAVALLGENEREHRLTFFETDEEGDRTKIIQTIEKGVAEPGDLVSIRFKSHATINRLNKSQVFVNDTAVSMTVLEKAE